jgi:hypothetical protein
MDPANFNEEYINQVVKPYKIAANFSLEKMDSYINIINSKLNKIKKLNPEDITQVILNNKEKYERILAALCLAYTMKEEGITYISAPEGMNSLLNYPHKP